MKSNQQSVTRSNSVKNERSLQTTLTIPIFTPTTPSQWLQKIAIDFRCRRREHVLERGRKTRQAQQRLEVRIRREREGEKKTWEENVGDKKKAKWRYRRRGQGWKCTLKGESTEEEREMGEDKEWRKKHKEDDWRETEGAGWGLWLPLLTAIDFL